MTFGKKQQIQRRAFRSNEGGKAKLNGAGKSRVSQAESSGWIYKKTPPAFWGHGGVPYSDGCCRSGMDL